METYTYFFALPTASATDFRFTANLFAKKSILVSDSGSEVTFEVTAGDATLKDLVRCFPKVKVESLIDLSVGLSLEAGPTAYDVMLDRSFAVLSEDYNLGIDGRSYTAR